MEQLYYTYNKPNKNLSIKQYVYKIGSYHYNWHNDIELLLVLNGEIEVCTNGVSKVLETDDLILINSNMGHATLAQKPNSVAMVIHIDPMVLKEYYDNIEFLFFDLCTTRETRYLKPFVTLRALLSQLMVSAQGREALDKIQYESTLYSLLYELASAFSPSHRDYASFIVNQKKLDAIDKMTAFILKNYKKKITLDKLAKESGYNSSYVSQLFKSYLGINFYDYLTRIRLREATRDLSHSEGKILDIALEHGFPDLKAFNTAFKDNFGKSPMAYRKQLNPENKEPDSTFKKVFLEVTNELVSEKLRGYIAQNREGADLKTQGLDPAVMAAKIEMENQLSQVAAKLSLLQSQLGETEKWALSQKEALSKV